MSGRRREISSARRQEAGFVPRLPWFSGYDLRASGHTAKRIGSGSLFEVCMALCANSRLSVRIVCFVVPVQCCFTSTETIRTIRLDREPRTSTSTSVHTAPEPQCRSDITVMADWYNRNGKTPNYLLLSSELCFLLKTLLHVACVNTLVWSAENSWDGVCNSHRRLGAFAAVLASLANHLSQNLVFKLIRSVAHFKNEKTLSFVLLMF